jgi:hypothetical protein
MQALLAPGPRVVMFRPGLALKPRLWPGLRRLWPLELLGQAKAINDGWLWPEPRPEYTKGKKKVVLSSGQYSAGRIGSRLKMPMCLHHY